MADGDVIAAIIQDTGEVIEIDQPCIPKRLTQTGLLLPANLPFEEWQSVLETLRGMEFSEVRRRNAARRGSVNGSRTASANTEPLRGSPLPLPAPGAALPVEPPDLDRVAIARAALGALDFDQRLALFLEHPGEVYVARLHPIAHYGG